MIVLPQELNPSGDGFIPGLALDFVIFGFHEGELKILVLEYQNTYLFALPGGFIYQNEALEMAAHRVAAERTGLTELYLEQFHTFGSLTRFDPKPLRTIMQANGLQPAADHWLLQRFVTVGYYALVDFTKAVPTPDPMSDRCRWYDLSSLPALMLDHHQIVEKALHCLRNDLDRKLIGFNLLGDSFTMNTLQSLYETILGEPLNRSSFQRRMINLGILERLDKTYNGKAHKAPFLYRFSH
ncbi:MAG: NUDIX domain-containing protein [Siphonobacter sp.]